MIFVEGGTFKMGDDNYDDAKVHSVTLSSFYISKYQVTNKGFCEFLNNNVNNDISKWIKIGDSSCKIAKSGNVFKVNSGFENHPVVMVSWYGATAYCNWRGGKLPTEAQWEFAARGGNKSKNYSYSGSNDLNEVAWYEENSGDKLHEVGTKKPNELGIYDMSGNVWEWCSDWYSEDYDSKGIDPLGPSSGSNRVNRGASFNRNADYCSVAYRRINTAGKQYNFLGFRLARPL